MIVAGYCPMGCGRTLERTYHGHILCSDPDCPNRDAVDNILNEPETEHIVTVTDKTWTVKHPLRERVNDDLLTCPLVRYIDTLALAGYLVARGADGPLRAIQYGDRDPIYRFEAVK